MNGASAFLLLAGFRLGLRALIQRWTKAGRFLRRIAVVGVNDFSHEFIERLQAEPDAFERRYVRFRLRTETVERLLRVNRYSRGRHRQATQVTSCSKADMNSRPSSDRA
jgi:hypothetical protein